MDAYLLWLDSIQSEPANPQAGISTSSSSSPLSQSSKSHVGCRNQPMLHPVGGQKRVSRRLQPEAYTILNDYFQNVSQWPDAAAQEELAERVRGVPGCEFYTARQVYAYFGNNRARIRTDGKDAILPTGDFTKRGRRRKATRTGLGIQGSPQTVSEQDSVIHKLDVLLDEVPDPSPEVAEIWAETLSNGVVPEHILTYAFLRRAKITQESLHEPNEKQLHTQARPEPESYEVHTDGPAPSQPPPPPQSAESRTPLLVSANPSPPDDDSPHQEQEERAAPPSALSPPPTNNEPAEGDGTALLPVSRPSPGLHPSGHQDAAGPAPASSQRPANRAVGPEALVERVRVALLEANSRGTRDSPKTFADFARWLKAHNEDRGAALYTTSLRRA